MRHAAFPGRLLAALVAGALILAPTTALAKSGHASAKAKAAAAAKAKAAAAAKAKAAKAKRPRTASFVAHGTVVSVADGVLSVAVRTSNVKPFRGQTITIDASAARVTKWDENVTLDKVETGAVVTVQGVGTVAGASLTGLKALRVHDLTPLPPVEETPAEEAPQESVEQEPAPAV